MFLVEEGRELLAQGFVPFGVMASDHSALEQDLLRVLRQFAPGADDGLPERKRKPFVVHRTYSRF
jgi:hypothetical protein